MIDIRQFQREGISQQLYDEIKDFVKQQLASVQAELEEAKRPAKSCENCRNYHLDPEEEPCNSCELFSDWRGEL